MDIPNERSLSETVLCHTYISSKLFYCIYIIDNKLNVHSKCSQYKGKRQNWIRGVEVAKGDAIIPV